MLCLVNSPEWPAAQFLLLSFSKKNDEELLNADGNVKMICIDLASQAASWLCSNHLLLSQDMSWARDVAKLQGKCILPV